VVRHLLLFDVNRANCDITHSTAAMNSGPLPTSASSSRPCRGFTLIELLVVIAILAVLAALIFVGATKAIKSAQAATNLGKIRDLAGVVGSYVGEYGHYPPGWDPSYTASGYGPPKMPWQGPRDRYPDILNAYMQKTEINDFFMSPTSGGTIKEFEGKSQPINFIGHPALIWHSSDKGSFGALGSPPMSPNRVSRPSQVFLFADGVPKTDAPDRNCQTSVRTWAQDGTITVSNPSRGEQVVNLKPTSNGGQDFSGIEFRNSNKAHVVFVDGHAEVFAPTDFKVKNVSLGF
jgi:prepilin-type N-terminal cleavage/methylation domain-containing protein/prepilin-type processing-associated H-X9-DG protein